MEKTSFFQDKLVLMNRDTEVGIFNGEYLQIFPGREALAPLCFSRSRWPLSKWADIRVLDVSRPNAKKLLRFFDLEYSQPTEILLKNHAVCLTDSYWVRKEHEQLTWEAVKPDTDILAPLALYGMLEEDVTSDIRSPELTNTGSYEKAWMKVNGIWSLIKHGTLEECFTEVLVSGIAGLLALDCTRYALDMESCTVSCQDFTQGHLNLEPMSYVVDDDIDYAKSFEWLECQDRSLTRSYLDMLFLDALVGNPDRHTNNYGLLRNPSTGEILRMAPIYDNHLALIASKVSASTSLISEFRSFVESLDFHWEPPVLYKQELSDVIDAFCMTCGYNTDTIVNRVWSNYLKLIE